MKNEAELEKFAEVEQGTIALISDTNVKPDTKTLFKIAKVFNIPTELLLTKNTIRAGKVIAALSIQEEHKATIAEYLEKETDYLSKVETVNSNSHSTVTEGIKQTAIITETGISQQVSSSEKPCPYGGL
ncbi:MAG: hypothetical protein HQL05_00620 [Nitrospirae bacterium]|uniref:hypothetical protein n=1 Tax=Candidatus Magnetobacterium casense TaxID=1455061 RepID=UPI0012DCD152|nr:hypothetical protein [Candidatus Magnetobacterium casensis]MBF0336310.1 hypothetical protein [Nitrospirota bacterium]